jgi:predicted small lipoprotein YifL
MGCKASFSANSPAIGKELNAADRPSPNDSAPRGVLQRFRSSVAIPKRPLILCRERRIAEILSLGLLVAALCLLGACGQKGPLTRPAKTASTPSAAPLPAAAASAAPSPQR